MTETERNSRQGISEGVASTLEQMDMFGAPLPTFNLKGETHVGTATGGLLSFCLTIVFLGYASLKLTHLIEAKGPKNNWYDYTTRINLNDINFKMAFSVEGYGQKKIKDDPKYVKLMAFRNYNKDGVEGQDVLSLHKCTQEDWDEFAAPARGMEDQMKDIKENPERGMYCLDEAQMADKDIYGNENNENYAILSFVLLPCNYVHTQFGYTQDKIHPECIANLTAQKEYLGPLKLQMYHTNELFNKKGYRDEAILRKSFLWHQQIDQKKPSFVFSEIEINMLEDEADLVQYGQSLQQTFYEFDRGLPQPSAWDQFPSPENPLTKYKYVSLELNVSPNMLTISRETYSLLDWMGDCGGLFDALCMVIGFFVGPLAMFSMQATLLSSFFKFKPKVGDSAQSMGGDQTEKQSLEVFCDQEKTKKGDLAVAETIIRDFSVQQSIKKLGFYATNLLCNKSYKKKMAKAHSRLEKELDLQKFIHRQRLWTTSMIGLLTGRQSLFVNKMSHLIIRESSESGNTSDDDELNGKQHDDVNEIHHMVNSGCKVDKRFINLFKVRRADQKNHNIQVAKDADQIDFQEVNQGASDTFENDISRHKDQNDKMIRDSSQNQEQITSLPPIVQVQHYNFSDIKQGSSHDDTEKVGNFDKAKKKVLGDSQDSKETQRKKLLTILEAVDLSDIESDQKKNER